MPNGEPTEPETPAPDAASLEGRLGIFDSVGSSLEDLVGAVRAIPKLVKEAAYYTYYTAKAALGLAAGVALAGVGAYFLPFTGVGGLVTNMALKGYHALILPVGIGFGQLLADWKNKEKPSFKKIANEVAVGGILGGILHHAFAGVQYVGNIVKGAYGTAASLVTKGGLGLAHLFPFLATHELLNRTLIKDYEPKPLKDIGKKVKGPLKWLIPPILANFTIVPDYLGPKYQMPWAAGISTAYGYLKAEPKKKEEKPAPQETPAPAGYSPQLAGMPGYGMRRTA